VGGHASASPTETIGARCAVRCSDSTKDECDPLDAGLIMAMIAHASALNGLLSDSEVEGQRARTAGRNIMVSRRSREVGVVWSRCQPVRRSERRIFAHQDIEPRLHKSARDDLFCRPPLSDADTARYASSWMSRSRSSLR
jgi:hypothetical protein